MAVAVYGMYNLRHGLVEIKSARPHCSDLGPGRPANHNYMPRRYGATVATGLRKKTARFRSHSSTITICFTG